jgi:hypothetical protein
VTFFLSLDRAIVFRSEEAGSVDPDLVKPLPEEPDLSKASYGGHCSFAYGRTRIFSTNFQSDQVMKFLISYRTSDIKWKGLD